LCPPYEKKRKKKKENDKERNKKRIKRRRRKGLRKKEITGLLVFNPSLPSSSPAAIAVH
jgi:hypothetical protein